MNLPDLGGAMNLLYIVGLFAILFWFTRKFPNQTLLTCPYCHYVWNARYPHNANNPPSSCPRCRKKLPRTFVKPQSLPRTPAKPQAPMVKSQAPRVNNNLSLSWWQQFFIGVGIALIMFYIFFRIF